MIYCKQYIKKTNKKACGFIHRLLFLYLKGFAPCCNYIKKGVSPLAFFDKKIAKLTPDWLNWKSVRISNETTVSGCWHLFLRCSNFIFSFISFSLSFLLTTIKYFYLTSTVLRMKYSFKGGDPAAPSGTATLLRLHPSHLSYLRQLLPCG